jgi:hypothetical protein
MEMAFKRELGNFMRNKAKYEQAVRLFQDAYGLLVKYDPNNYEELG